MDKLDIVLLTPIFDLRVSELKAIISVQDVSELAIQILPESFEKGGDIFFGPSNWRNKMATS